MKKDQNLPKKTFIALIVQENPFQMTPTTLDNNHPIIQIKEDDHHTEEILHKIDHIVGIVNIKFKSTQI